MSLENITQNNLINKGLFSLIYYAIDNNKNNYAIKFSKIGKKCIIKTLREFDFCEIMSEKYPNHFVKFYDYKFMLDDKQMDFSQFYNLLNEEQKQYYTNIINGDFLSIKLYSYIDTTLYDYMNNWNKFNYEVFYDLFIQLIYVINLMHSNGYFHNDLHFRNIGMKKTDNKFIEILGNKIKTHGFNIVIIDNDSVLHKKYDLTDEELEEINFKNDLFGIINSLYSFEDLKKKFNEFNNINYTFFNIDEDCLNVIKNYTNNLIMNKETEIFINNTLYKLLFYGKIQSDILKVRIRNPIKPFFLLPIEKILFIISNINSPDKILNYLITSRFD